MPKFLHIRRGRSHLAWPVLALAVLGVLGSAQVRADDSMRCGDKLVQSGDPAAKLLALCGEPVDRQTRFILRHPSYDFYGRPIYLGREVVEVPVETWTYNFGPHRLMRRVRIVDSLVDEIETLGYGYNEDN